VPLLLGQWIRDKWYVASQRLSNTAIIENKVRVWLSSVDEAATNRPLAQSSVGFASSSMVASTATAAAVLPIAAAALAPNGSKRARDSASDDVEPAMNKRAAL
jgi:hypothetical protein